MSKPLSLLFSIAVIVFNVIESWAQAPQAAVQAVLARHVPAQLPADVILTGQVTDSTGAVQPFRITMKGKDQIRYEIGQGASLVTTTQSRGSGWSESRGKVQILQTTSAIRRPGIVPFLDLLGEANSNRLQVTDKGNFSVGTVLTRRFTLKLPDATPNTRLSRRPLDEESELYVDATSLLVVRSESSVAAENNPVAKVQSFLEFADYRTVNGLAIPFRVRNTVVFPGQKPAQWTYTVNEALVNTGVAESIFTQEAGR
jgi:hypothetical protein